MAHYASILTAGTNNHTTTSEEANYVATDFATDGIVGTVTNTGGIAPMTGGYAVNAQGTPDMTVAVTAGAAYVTATPSGQASQSIRTRLSASEDVTISSNSTGSTKYDWLYIKIDPTTAANPGADGDDVASLVTSRSSSKTSDDGTPPTYGYLLAVITVANGASTITNGNITDSRDTSSVTSTDTAVTTGWIDNVLPTPDTITNNGNRSYSLVFEDTDITDTVSEGMRLKTTRTVTAPTKCTSLNGSSQYYSKSSPSGCTFTDDFAVSAWVKLDSYGSSCAIVTRYNGTSGFQAYIDSSGSVTLRGYNANAANYSGVVSYQSIPLNKWVHIAAQLDMSGYAVAADKSYIMIDGVDVPCSVSRAGTNPTALLQAGDLCVGGRTSGGIEFDGKIAQVAVFGAKVTQATMRSYMSQGLSGSETNLVAAYSFNDAITDLSANGNNLTAQGSATADNTDSPFTQDSSGTPSGTTDYAIVMAKSFSTDTTLVVQVPEGCTIPTSGGISAVSYSVQDTPYGFPKDDFGWTIEYLTAGITGLSSANDTWLNPNGNNVIVPIGAWGLRYSISVTVLNATAKTWATLSTANNTESDIRFTSYGEVLSAVSGAGLPHEGSADVSLATATPYYLNIKQNSGSTANTYTNNLKPKVFAKPSYL